MYVDPRNYDSMNQAFQEVGVREIPPKEISDLDEIGVGKRQKCLMCLFIGKHNLLNLTGTCRKGV